MKKMSKIEMSPEEFKKTYDCYPDELKDEQPRTLSNSPAILNMLKEQGISIYDLKPETYLEMKKNTKCNVDLEWCKNDLKKYQNPNYEAKVKIAKRISTFFSIIKARLVDIKRFRHQLI